MISTQELSRACRLFMEQAYPDGLDSIPENRRAYWSIAPGGALSDYLPPGPFAAGICQDLTRRGATGFEFRLGSHAHPHLKLRIQLTDLHGREVWVYSVDTHDHFLQAAQHVSAEEAEAWKLLVETNRALKHRIESALAAAGYMTPVSLLMVDLTT
jgi:hypothetical protein